MSCHSKQSLETSHDVQCHEEQTRNADLVWCHSGQGGKRGGNEGVKGVQSKGELMGMGISEHNYKLRLMEETHIDIVIQIECTQTAH